MLPRRRASESKARRSAGLSRWLALALAASISVAAAPSTALADETAPVQVRAARVFADGERAFSAGDYARAAELFEEAYALRPHPASLANAAKARRTMGDLATAANHYQRLAVEASSAADVSEAKAALASLSPMLGRITVKAHADKNGAVSVDGKTSDAESTFVAPGTHTVELAGVRGAKRVVRVAEGETVAVAFDDPPAALPARETPPAPTTSPTPVEPSPQRTGPISPLVTMIAAGLTLASAGVATWSGIDTLNERDAWDARPSNETLDAGLDKQRRTNILIGVTIGLGAITGVLAIFTSWRGGGSASTRAFDRVTF